MLYESEKLLQFQSVGRKWRNPLRSSGPPKWPSSYPCSLDSYLSQDLTSHFMWLYKITECFSRGELAGIYFWKVSGLWLPGVIYVLAPIWPAAGSLRPPHPARAPWLLFTDSTFRLPFLSTPVNAEHHVWNCFQSFCCKDIIWLLP